MNKRDYIREVEAIHTPDHLRRRITSLPGRRTARSFRWGRLLSLAACLVLAAALAAALPALLRGLHPGGEILTPPVSTSSGDTIPDGELAELLAAEFPDGQPGDTWELLCSLPGEGRTLGVLRHAASSHAGGLGNLILGIFDNRTREPAEPVTIINGDAGDVHTWEDAATLQRYLLCTNFTTYQGREESCTAALFVFDGSKLVAVTALPEATLGVEGLPEGAETMFQADTAFWEDHKGVINGAGLDLYERNPDWDASQGGEGGQWTYLCYLPLGTEAQAPVSDEKDPAQTAPTTGFDWYNPPVLPLIADGDSSGLKVWRKLTFDFTDDLFNAQGFEGYTPTPLVTDRYVVQNTGSTEQYFLLRYPQASNLTASSNLPSITIDGEPLELDPGIVPLVGGALFPGTSDSWSGTFTAWEDYRDAMDSGDALAGARAMPQITLREEPAAVYDIVPQENYEAVRDSLDDPWAAAMAVDCTLSDPGAQVFVYGMEGYQPLSEDGLSRRYSFSLNDNASGLHRIIVVGGTLEVGPVTAYTDGSCTSAVPQLTGRVDYTAPGTLEDGLLGNALYDCVKDFYYQPDGSLLYTEGTLHRTLCDLILNYVSGRDLSAVAGGMFRGVFDGEYDSAFTRVEDLLYNVSGMLRFFFWPCEVTIPAGGHVVIEAAQYVSPSCAQTEDEDGYLVTGAPYGFDFAPALTDSPPLAALEVEVIHNGGLTLAESSFDLTFDGYGAVSYPDPGAVRHLFSVRTDG